MEEDVTTRWIWVFMLGEADFNGIFDGSPESLARRANVSLSEMQYALEVFQAPDRNSKSKIEGGRRLIYQGANKWWIVNYVEYRTKEEDDRSYQKMQWRKRKAKQYALEKGEVFDENAWYREDALRQGISRDVTGVHDYKDKDKDIDIDNVVGSNSSNSVGKEWDEDEWSREDARRQGHLVAGLSRDGHDNTDADTDTDNVVGSNSSNTVGKRVPVSSNPPSIDEIYQHLMEKGWKGNDKLLKLAEDIVEHHENGGKWRTSKGKPIYVWKSHVNQWADNRKGDLTPNVMKMFAKQSEAKARAKGGEKSAEKK
jgi:hypothetical protein